MDECGEQMLYGLCNWPEFWRLAHATTDWLPASCHVVLLTKKNTNICPEAGSAYTTEDDDGVEEQ